MTRAVALGTLVLALCAAGCATQSSVVLTPEEQYAPELVTVPH
jgi:hypothetical protein